MESRSENFNLFFEGEDYRIIPNKFGMKYWAGANRPEGALSHREAETLAEYEAGEYLFFYPYPDHDFPMTIYSDDYLPGVGQLRENIVNFDEDRFVFFDEGRKFDEVIKDGMFPYFANSFVLVKNSDRKLPVYARFATDRARRFSVATAIFKKEGGYRIQKRPVYEEARGHIRHIFEMKERLKEVFGNRLSINECRIVGDAMGLEYINGRPLSEIILENHDLELLDKFVALLRQTETIEYNETADFVAVFGEHGEYFKGHRSMPVTDIDLVPQNVLVRGDNGEMVLIDYEWTFEFPIPVEYVVYRAVTMTADSFYGERSEEHKMLYERYGIHEKLLKRFTIMERKFQEYICDGKPAMRQMVDLNGRLHADMRNSEAELIKLNDELNHIKSTRMWRVRSFFRKIFKGGKNR